jgi:restriction endonuclease S subunit
MSQMVKLSDIAELNLGQTFRGKAEASDGSSGIKLVQIKDIQEGVISSDIPLSYANLELSKLKVELKSGDLLLPLRGSRYEAAIFECNSDKKVVTTTNQIAIIRPKLSKVRLKFLLWYFNSESGRNKLKSLNSGTTIPSIKRGDLASLAFALPELQIQDQLIKIYMNWYQQKKVLSQMLVNGERMTNRFCEKLVLGESGISD